MENDALIRGKWMENMETGSLFDWLKLIATSSHSSPL